MRWPWSKPTPIRDLSAPATQADLDRIARILTAQAATIRDQGARIRQCEEALQRADDVIGRMSRAMTRLAEGSTAAALGMRVAALELRIALPVSDTLWREDLTDAAWADAVIGKTSGGG